MKIRTKNEKSKGVYFTLITPTTIGRNNNNNATGANIRLPLSLDAVLQIIPFDTTRVARWGLILIKMFALCSAPTAQLKIISPLLAVCGLIIFTTAALQSCHHR